MAIKAIFFDSGNVLMKERFTSGIARYEKKYHIPKNLLYRSCHDRPYWREFTLGNISEIEYLKNIKQDFKGKLNIRELNRMMYKSTPPNRDMIKFARSLKNKFYLGIISNNPKEWFDFFWKKFGWYKIFNSKSVSSYLHVRKPNVKIFKDALKKAKIKGNEAIYIDDRPERGNAAQNLGIKVLIFKNINQLKKDINYLKEKI
jgi:putative hydrolase of the HAD superfamily